MSQIIFKSEIKEKKNAEKFKKKEISNQSKLYMKYIIQQKIFVCLFFFKIYSGCIW